VSPHVLVAEKFAKQAVDVDIALATIARLEIKLQI
jgi:hypothetical protein